MVQIRKYESSMKCMKSYFSGLEMFDNHFKKTEKKLSEKVPKHIFCVALLTM